MPRVHGSWSARRHLPLLPIWTAPHLSFLLLPPVFAPPPTPLFLLTCDLQHWLHSCLDLDICQLADDGSAIPLPSAVFTLRTVEAAHKTWVPHVLQHSAWLLAEHMVMTSRFPRAEPTGGAVWLCRPCQVDCEPLLLRPSFLHREDVSRVFISQEVRGHVWTQFFLTGSLSLTVREMCRVGSCSFYWPTSVTLVFMNVVLLLLHLCFFKNTECTIFVPSSVFFMRADINILKLWLYFSLFILFLFFMTVFFFITISFFQVRTSAREHDSWPYVAVDPGRCQVLRFPLSKC